MNFDPSMNAELAKTTRPERFTSRDSGTAGWRIRLAHGLPLATPAVVDGRVFLGGGFGSFDFYALDAVTGRVIWQYRSTDDGPSAAVVEQGCVVFSTESCELEVLTVGGERVWKRWLGDPLMSMPAVGGGRVYMAYPDSRGDREHYLACFELVSGKRLWNQRLSGELITAPILANGRVYLTTLDGTIHCFDQTKGILHWRDAVCATSSPTVSWGRCYYSQREEVLSNDGSSKRAQTEHCAWREAAVDSTSQALRDTRHRADFLDITKRATRSKLYAKAQLSDTSVGFAVAPGSSKIYQAMKNLGTGHVFGIWSFQGSKPFLSERRLFDSMGDTVCCLDLETEEVLWKTSLRDDDAESELLDFFLTPPCLVNGKVFVASRHGEVYSFAADSGEQLWHVHIGEPIAFQPAVANGRVYVATETGWLYCLETGDSSDDGWLMWGATARHNGLDLPEDKRCNDGDEAPQPYNSKHLFSPKPPRYKRAAVLV
jgi:outer membrane protein assembly factor BamB